MSSTRSIGITTTSSLDGWEITDYLGPVVAHVVAGSGFVSDLFAGFSDVFGGRSGAYQAQLRSISDEALSSLRRAAYDQRANWVIGVSLDIDEVSGKGMQMFMVSATGTAVRAVRKVNALPHVGGTVGGLQARSATPDASTMPRLSLDTVQTAARRYDALATIDTGQLKWTTAAWSTIIEDRLAEAAPLVIREAAVRRRVAGTSPDDDAFWKNAVAYFERLDDTDAVDALYGAVEQGGSAADVAADLLSKTNLRSLPSILRLLDHEDHDIRRRALQTLKYSQRSYGPEDITLLDAIATRCAETGTFSLYGEVIPAGGRGLFGVKGERFRCTCGTERDADESLCHAFVCNRDRFGFRAGEMTAATGGAHATRAAALLRRIYAAFAPSPVEPDSPSGAQL